MGQLWLIVWQVRPGERLVHSWEEEVTREEVAGEAPSRTGGGQSFPGGLDRVNLLPTCSSDSRSLLAQPTLPFQT